MKGNDHKLGLPQPWRLRDLMVNDVDAVCQLQLQCYGPQFLEERSVMMQRLAFGHHCSIGVYRPEDNVLGAYLIAYRSVLGKVTSLNGEFALEPAGQPVLYLHDLSVHPGLAGRSVGSFLVRRAFAQAKQKNIDMAALVCVQGSRPWWSKFGFVEQKPASKQQHDNLARYGKDACYMVAKI